MTQIWKEATPNQIHEIFFNSISSLDLSHFRLNNIQCDFFNEMALNENFFNNLVIINLSNNDLNKICKGEFNQLVSLTELNLSSNKIKVIEPDAFKGM